jgi:hypothetical protein
MTLLFVMVAPSKGAWMAPFLMAIISEYLGLRLTACTRWDSSQLLCSFRSTYPCDPARNNTKPECSRQNSCRASFSSRCTCQTTRLRINILLY